MLRRIGTLGLGIVMRGGDKLAGKMHRVSKLARHPRTEITGLVHRLVETGEIELEKVETILRQRLADHDAKTVHPTPTPAGHLHKPSSTKVKNGDLVTFTDLKTEKSLVGQVKTTDLDRDHRFFLVRVVNDAEETGKYYVCREAANGGYVGEDEI